MNAQLQMLTKGKQGECVATRVYRKGRRGNFFNKQCTNEQKKSCEAMLKAFEKDVNLFYKDIAVCCIIIMSLILIVLWIAEYADPKLFSGNIAYFQYPALAICIVGYVFYYFPVCVKDFNVVITAQLNKYQDILKSRNLTLQYTGVQKNSVNFSFYFQVDAGQINQAGFSEIVINEQHIQQIQPAQQQQSEFPNQQIPNQNPQQISLMGGVNNRPAFGQQHPTPLMVPAQSTGATQLPPLTANRPPQLPPLNANANMNNAVKTQHNTNQINLDDE